MFYKFQLWEESIYFFLLEGLWNLGASQISNLGPRMASKLCPSSPALGFSNSSLLPKSRQSTETTFPTPTTKLWRNSARSASLHQSGAEWRIPSAMSSAQSATQKQDENQNGNVSLEAGTVSKDLVSLPRPLYVTDLATPPSHGSQFRVAYQGARGAYSEAAALKAYPQCEVVPCEQFEEAFQVVELRLVDKAVLPIENSLGGSIHRNYDLLLSHRLHIVGEVQLAAHHCLLGLPGVKKEELKRVVSHPQKEELKHVVSHPEALSQCEHTLSTLGLICKAIDDTVGVAQFIACNNLRDTGVVASARAAEIYGLQILADGTQVSRRSRRDILYIASSLENHKMFLICK